MLNLSFYLSLSLAVVTSLFDMCMKILIDNIDGKNVRHLLWYHKANFIFHNGPFKNN